MMKKILIFLSIALTSQPIQSSWTKGLSYALHGLFGLSVAALTLVTKKSIHKLDNSQKTWIENLKQVDSTLENFCRNSLKKANLPN